jgi:hypothetical protein
MHRIFSFAGELSRFDVFSMQLSSNEVNINEIENG